MQMEDVFRKVGTGVTLSQKIERKIEQAIRQRKLLPGTRLPSEKELCDQFSVSRTALREALRRLSARGLIDVRKGSGIYIRELKIEDAINSVSLFYDLRFDTGLILKIIEVLRILEPEIARLAAMNRTDSDIKILRKNISDLEKCNPGNTRLETALISRFHMNLAKSTHNPVIKISLEPVFLLLPRLKNLVKENIEGEKDYTLKYQRIIISAIIDRDTRRASEACAELIGRYVHAYSKYFKKPD